MLVPEDWKSLIKKLKRSRQRSIIFVAGGTDTGKSMLCQFLVGGFYKAGFSVAMVDADPGQSTIGPPTTIGLATFKTVKGAVHGKEMCEETDELPTVESQSMHFVGSTQPVGHLLQTLVGVKKLTDKAVRQGAEKIVMDTTGLIEGSIGREFKFQKIDLIRPTHIITLERKNELGDLVKNFLNTKSISIHRFPVSPEAKPKSPAQRRLYREERFRIYFDKVYEQCFSLKTVGLHGMMPDFNKSGNARGLLIGLCDDSNSTLGLGIIQRIDPHGGSVSYISPLRNADRIKTIQFGSIYLDKSGRQLR